MNSDVKDRIRQLIQELCAGNGSRFATLIGMSQSSVSTLVNETRGNPTYETLYKILTGSNIRVNPSWLMLGEGRMLLDGNATSVSQNLENSIVKPERRNALGIPVVSLDNVRRYSLQRKYDVAQSFVISEDLRATGAELLVRINGDDMFPEVPCGSLVALRRDNDLLVLGGTYLLDINGIFMLRNVRREGDFLYLSSCNSKYSEIKVALRKMRFAFLQVGLLRLS